MTTENAIRWLHHQARTCRDRDSSEAFCLLLPALVRILCLDPMEEIQTTELVCFRLQEPKAWDCVRELGAEVEKVKAIPLGQFAALNRLSGGKLTGRIF